MSQIPESRKADWHHLPPTLRKGKPVHRKYKVKVERHLLRIDHLLKFKENAPANVIARLPIRTFELQQLQKMPPKAYLEVEQVRTRLDPEPFYYIDNLQLCDSSGDDLPVPEPDGDEHATPLPPPFQIPEAHADTLISCAQLLFRDHILFKQDPKLQQIANEAAAFARLAMNMQRSPEESLAAYFATIANAFHRKSETRIPRKQAKRASRLSTLIPRKGIHTQRREYEPNRFTNDIYRDGKLYAPAVGDSILKWTLTAIKQTKTNDKRNKTKTTNPTR